MQRYLRLRRKEDFAHLRQTGQTWRSPLLILSVTPNGLPHNRYGFVTSKQLGSAVRRNRVRRLLREVMRHAHPHLVQGYDVAVIARGPIAGQPFQIVEEAVVTSLQRARLWLTPGEQSG